MAGATLHELEEFRRLITGRLGLVFDESRLGLLVEVLHTRAQAQGRSVASYLGELERSRAMDPGRLPDVEWRELAALLTVGETYFFRNPDQFAALCQDDLPGLIRGRSPARPLRLLSAGCASGEEAYTLAILFADRFPGLGEGVVDIRAIDINPRALEKAVAGRYTPWSLRQLPDDIRARHFRAVGKDFQLDENIRRAVTFAERNLTEPDPAFWSRGAFDIVFCRNVIMYFDQEAAAGAVDCFAEALSPDGLLFLGHAETLRGLSPAFHLRHAHQAFYYQRRHEPSLRGQESIATAGVPGPRGDTDWVDRIRDASERIASLARGRPASMPANESSLSSGPSGSSPSAPAQRKDLGVVEELLRQERFAEGLALLQDLPAVRALEPDAQLLQVVLLTSSGQVEQAEPILRRLLADDDLNVGAHYMLALCHEHRRDQPAAFEHNRAAAYLDPSFAMPHLHLGLMARRAGDLDTARFELARALVLLRREDASRVLLFGGGFNRDTLLGLCRAELRASGGAA